MEHSQRVLSATKLLDDLRFRAILLRHRRIEYFAHCGVAAWWCGGANRVAMSGGVLCCQGGPSS
jgi:hypothetical protein